MAAIRRYARNAANQFGSVADGSIYLPTEIEITCTSTQLLIDAIRKQLADRCKESAEAKDPQSPKE